MSESLCITYKRDCDIIKVNKKIENLLTADSNALDKLRQEIVSLQQKIRMTNMTNQKFHLLDKIQVIKKKIIEFETGEKLKSFQTTVADVLKKYKALPSSETKVTFGSKNQDGISAEREDVIMEFLALAGRYVEIEVHRTIMNDERCPNCRADVKDLTEPSNGDILECPGCGFHLLPLRDSGENTMVGDYKDRENFEKTIVNYQGREKINFPNHLFEALDKYYLAFGLSSGEDIRQKKAIDPGYTNLRMALQKTGYTIYYDHIWLLANVYWNKPLGNIRHLQEILMRDYDITERIFKQIKGANRKASINTKWRLVKQLKMRNYPVPKDDFKIVETPEILEYYETVWKQMCDGANDKDIKYQRGI